MAAPKRNRTKPSDPLFLKTREKIRVSQLIDRLQNNALGTLKKNSGKSKDENYTEEYIEMTTGQLKSAEILLNKSLPSLQNVTIAGDPEKPLEITVSPKDKLKDFLDGQAKALGEPGDTSDD